MFKLKQTKRNAVDLMPKILYESITCVDLHLQRKTVKVWNGERTIKKYRRMKIYWKKARWVLFTASWLYFSSLKRGYYSCTASFLECPANMWRQIISQGGEFQLYLTSHFCWGWVILQQFFWKCQIPTLCPTSSSPHRLDIDRCITLTNLVWK